MKFRNLRQITRDYFVFTRRERNGLIVLCIILIVLIGVNYSLNFIKDKSVSDFSKVEEAINKLESEKEENINKAILFKFNPNTISPDSLALLPLSEFVKRNILKYRESGGYFNSKESVGKIYGMNDSILNIISVYLIFNDNANNKKVQKIILEKPELSYHVFDPNIADEKDLKNLGFSGFQIKNLIKYRENGGHFYKSADLLKIYGVDSSFYLKISSWIKIESDKKPPITEKELLVLELNSADSTSLDALPGIGPVFASRIIKYRNLLGGFNSKSQLLEVYNFKEETLKMIEKQITIDTTSIKKLSLNFSQYNDFVKHPYINNTIANRILETRNIHGAYKTCSEILTENVLSSDEYLKIRSYLKLN